MVALGEHHQAVLDVKILRIEHARAILTESPAPPQSLLRSAPYDAHMNGEMPLAVFSGELDIRNVTWFRRELVYALGSEPSLVVDLGAITHIDSSVVVALVELNDECKQRRGRLIFAHPSRSVERVLRMTGLGNFVATSDELRGMRTYPSTMARI
jgi:anti-anti-sigma factor